MDSKLRSLCDDLHQKSKHHRSIEALISSLRFERLWDCSSPDEQEKVMLFIQFGYRSRVVEWLKSHPSLDLSERPIGYLRDLGQKRRITNYSRLSKSELVGEIKKEQQDYEANERRDGRKNIGNC